MKRLLLAASLLLVTGCSSDPIPLEAEPGQSPPLGDLLAVDEELALDGVTGPVDAVRDDNGRWHIYATNVADAMTVQGYLCARDRGAQMEIFRRFAEGRLAPVLGQLTSDITMRHIGLHRVAKEMYELLEDDTRVVLDAYASGASQYFAKIRSGEASLPEGLTLLEPKHFDDWTGVNTLSMGRLLTWQLSFDNDLPLSDVTSALKTTFAADNLDPLIAVRAGFERDVFRFEPPDHATTIEGFGDIGPGPLPTPPPSQSRGDAPEPTASSPQQLAQRRALIDNARGWTHGVEKVRHAWSRGGAVGSNNWAVASELSDTGYPMLASDPHLGLSSPAIWWPISLHIDTGDEATRIEGGGVTFAGVPGFVLGHNQHVSWGATVTANDVTDYYQETLNADATAVMHKGKEIPLETVIEEIERADGSILSYEVKIVPHHGPIIPTIVGEDVAPLDPAAGAISVHWTGMQATGEMEALNDLLRARDVDEGRKALEQWGSGGQNWMLADDGGNIAWTSHSLIPYRRSGALNWDPTSYEGNLPCLLLPGDGSADWDGFWAADSVPWAKNPAAGFLATANQDPVGNTLDNDPSNDLQPDGKSGFLGCSFAAGFRQGRIKHRIANNGAPLTLDDMASIQGDHRSALGARMVPALLLAIDNAQREDSVMGSHPDLTAIVADPDYDTAFVDQVKGVLLSWQNESDFAAATGVNLDDNSPLGLDTPEGRAGQATLIFNAWFVRFLNRVFGDEFARVNRPEGHGASHRGVLHMLDSDPATLATFDAATGDSAIWDDLDTQAVESRHERMIRALIDARVSLLAQYGAMDSWRWGHHHVVTFSPDNPLWAAMRIPPADDANFPDGFPRHGDLYAVDASQYGSIRVLDGLLWFDFGAGASQRFVAEMRPDGPVVRNAIPGGTVFDNANPHFADQAEEWRRNENHVVPFVLDAVIEAAESRTLFRPSGNPAAGPNSN